MGKINVRRVILGGLLAGLVVNIGEFVKKFNDLTRDANGITIPVEITVYRDRTFDFITKSPPAAVLLKKAAGIAKGSGVPNKEKVAQVTPAQVREIAVEKMADLNAASAEAAESTLKLLELAEQLDFDLPLDRAQEQIFDRLTALHADLDGLLFEDLLKALQISVRALPPAKSE